MSVSDWSSSRSAILRNGDVLLILRWCGQLMISVCSLCVGSGVTHCGEPPEVQCAGQDPGAAWYPISCSCFSGIWRSFLWSLMVTSTCPTVQHMFCCLAWPHIPCPSGRGGPCRQSSDYQVQRTRVCGEPLLLVHCTRHQNIKHWTRQVKVNHTSHQWILMVVHNHHIVCLRSACTSPTERRWERAWAVASWWILCLSSDTGRPWWSLLSMQEYKHWSEGESSKFRQILSVSKKNSTSWYY